MYKEHVEDPKRDEADARAVSDTYGLDLNMAAPASDVVPFTKAS